MKRIVFSLICLAGISTSARAQSQSAFGLKLGASLANVVGDDVSSSDFKVGVVGGGFATFPVGSKVAIQPELLFSQKGDQTTISGTTIKGMLNYLDLPVLVQLFPSTSRFYIGLGPQVGFLLSGKVTDGRQTQKITNLKTVDFGFVLGLGYKLTNGLVVDARYNAGLSSVYKEVKTMYTTASPEVRNNAIQFSLGYQFAQ